MTLAEGELVDGKYRVLRKIGEGGMGAVYEAENTRISRRVAIKTLNAAAAAKADMIERFEREAQAAGRIGNDHILEVLDLGTLPDGDRFIVMEFLDGENLGDRIKRAGALPPRELSSMVIQVCDGLQAAHDAGIIHRDLKPDNIFLVREKAGIKDFVKIIDFGISKFQTLGGDMSMTRTGTLLGTPYYMSPEQARGARGADHRTDIYALGVIMFEALTGEVPFSGETFNELLFNIVLAQPPSLEEKLPNLDPNLAAIVRKAMDREAALRFGSVRELGDALAAWLKGSHAGTALMQAPQIPSGTAVMSPVQGQPAGSAPNGTVVQPMAPAAPAMTQPIAHQAGAGTPNMMGGAPNMMGAPHVSPVTPGGVALDEPVQVPMKRGSAGLVIGAVALLGVLGLAAVGLFLVTRSGDDAAETATTEASAEAPPSAAGDAAAPAATADAAAAEAEQADAGGESVDASAAADAQPAEAPAPEEPKQAAGSSPPKPTSGAGSPKTQAKPPPPTKTKPKPGGGFDFGY